INTETWDKVHAQLAANAGRKRGRVNSTHPSLLAGLLFTAEGVPFTPSHAVNHGRRYRYYVERPLLTPDAEKGRSSAPLRNDSGNGVQTQGWRLPAHEIEQLVLKRVAAFLGDRGALLDVLRLKRKSPDLVSAVLGRALNLADRCDSSSFTSHLEIVAALVQRVTIAQDQVTIEIGRDTLANHLLGEEGCSSSRSKVRQPITIEVPVRFRRRGVEAKLVVQRQLGSGFEPDANLIKALTRAHEWFGRIVRGEANGVGDIARAERLDRTYVTRVLCLAFLAPEVIHAILDGRQPTELTAKRLVSYSLRVPLLWPQQRLFLIK
ncbi:MAG: hypothetical protein ACRD9W_20785, partial [Terriglobia bacterium]